MKPIEVGDLVIVLAHCCEHSPLGKVGTVTYLYRGAGPCGCGSDHLDVSAAMVSGLPRIGFRTSWLKRIPPLQELDDVKRDEEITA